MLADADVTGQARSRPAATVIPDGDVAIRAFVPTMYHDQSGATLVIWSNQSRTLLAPILMSDTATVTSTPVGYEPLWTPYPTATIPHDPYVPTVAPTP